MSDTIKANTGYASVDGDGTVSLHQLEKAAGIFSHPVVVLPRNEFDALQAHIRKLGRELAAEVRKVEKCREAIDHTLGRIHTHPHIGWYCGWGTQTFAGLCEALALITGQSRDAMEDKYAPIDPKKPETPEVTEHDIYRILEKINPKDSGMTIVRVMHEFGYCPNWLAMTPAERALAGQCQENMVDEFIFEGRRSKK